MSSTFLKKYLKWYNRSMQYNTKPTNKQKEFARILATDKKATKVSAFKQAYDTSGYKSNDTIKQVAHQVFKTKGVQSELMKYNDIVEDTLVNTVKDWGNHEKPRQREIAIDTAKFMHDKIHGKATQKIQQQTESITLNIDLTGIEAS